jgi:putative ABC transport system permease protein
MAHTTSALWRKAVTDVTRRKGRTILVILGILIGVSGLTAINVTNTALYDAFSYSASRAAAPNMDFTVQSTDPAIVSNLSSQPNVAVAQGRTYYRTRWQTTVAPGHVKIGIVGYADLQHVTLEPFQLLDGHWPGAGEVLMEHSDMDFQSFKIGDSIAVLTPSGFQTLHVVGTVRTLGLGDALYTGSARAYMRLEDLNQVAGYTGVNDLQVKVRDTTTLNTTAQNLSALLRARGITILSSSTTANAYDPSYTNGLFVIMRALAIIALILTAFLIINTVSTLVTEQIPIIGMMKAIGASRTTVIRGYLFSVAIYAIVGTVLGIGLGMVGGQYFTQFLANLAILDLGPFHWSWGTILVSVAVGLGIPLLAAIIPLWTGTSMTVRTALSGYGLTPQGSGRQRQSRLGWISQTTWLGLRSLFRRRGRAILTLMALAASATAFLAVQTTITSADASLNQRFSQYNADVFLSITPQPYAAVQAQLHHTANIARVERFEQQPVTSQWGELVLTGIEQDSQLYHIHLISGRWLVPGELNALVISDATARKTGLKPGDTIALHTASAAATWRIVGEDHDTSGSVGTVGVSVTTIDNLHAFNQLPSDLTTSLLIQAQDRSTAAVNELAANLDTNLSQAGWNPDITTKQENIQLNQAQIQILYVLLYAVAGIVALVGILGLANTLTTAVLERRREIGILRSMGASGWRVARVFLVEGLALAGMAWGIGVILGLPVAYGFVSLIDQVFFSLDFSFSPMATVTMLIFTLIIAMIASVGPALSAAHARVATILRYE